MHFLKVLVSVNIPITVAATNLFSLSSERKVEQELIEPQTFRYEHAVYVLDAFIYSMTHWPRIGNAFDGSFSISSCDLEESCPSSSQPSRAEEGSSTEDTKPSAPSESKRRRRQSYEREALIKFFGMDVMQSDKEKFLNSLQDTVQQKFPKVPKASWEVFTHNVTIARQKSSDDTKLALRRENEDDCSLPTSFSTKGV